MKILVSIILTCFSIVSHCQNNISDELLNYIKSKDNYISLNNSKKINVVTNNYILVIQKYLESKNDNINNYYTEYDKIINLRVENKMVSIPIYHIDGFKTMLDLEKEDIKRSDGQKTIITGNLSGKDGIVKINTKRMEVIEFKDWD